MLTNRRNFYLTNKEKRNLAISFFFPLYPIKTFSNVKSMVVLCFLMSLRFVVQFTSIHIPTINMTISISWTPIMVIGWIYGPVIGLFVGAITDTIGFLLKPSIWFWLYAIQEPLVVCLSGILGSIYWIIRKKQKTSFVKELLLLEIVVISFVIVSILSLTYLVNEYSFEGMKTNSDFVFINESKWIILLSVVFFFIAIQLIIFILIKKNKKLIKGFCLPIILVFLCSIIFSFILGPISANEYYKYIHNGQSSPNFIKYGSMFYLVPRAIKESIKAPLEIFILLSILPLITKTVDELKKNNFQKWSYHPTKLHKKH